MPSLVQVSESNAIVYISSSSVFSDLMTIRDIAGDRSTSNTITISTRSGLLFAGGTYTQTLDTPYASLTVNPSTGQIVHKFPFTYGQSVDLDSLTSLGHLDLNVPTLLSNSLYIANSISSFGGIDASTILIRGNVVNTRPELISTILNLGQVYTSSLYVPIDSLQSNGFTVSSNLLSTVGGALPYISTQEFQSTLYSSLSNFVMQSNMTSTIDGLGSSGFISKAGLISTVQGLGTAGYISSSWFISTVSSMQADINKPAGTWFYISTNAGLANSGYISTSQLTSTVEGLGQLYISSAILSTVSFLSGYDIGFFTKTLLGPGFLSNPTGVAVDTSGNIYVADTNNNMIRRIDTTGAVTVYAGSSNAGSANGPASNATFNGPRGIAVDSTGVYVADTGNNLIRYISGGIVSTYAGTSAVGSSNGAASNATFNGPRGIAIDSTGLYVADTGNNLIRQIINSNVTTLAGTGSAGSADGSLATASFNSPVDVEVSFGIVYVADRLNSKIRQISLAGVTTIASNFSPTVLAYSPGSNILYAFDTNNVLRQVLPTLSIITGSTQGFVDGSRTVASFNSPSGLAVDSSGNIYVGDSGNNSIRKVVLAPPINLVSTVQGLGSIYITKQALITAVQDATVSLAPLPPTVTTIATLGISGSGGIALDSSGNIYICNQITGTVSRVDINKNITILASNFRVPWGVAVDMSKNVYICDQVNGRIVKINTQNNNLITFLISGLSGPKGIAVDTSGNIYFTVTNGQYIGKINTSGFVTDFVGNRYAGFSNGMGTSAQISYPYGIAVDSAGIVYFADTGNFRIRKISPSGNVTTLAGSGIQGSNDGQGSNARFNFPNAMAVDSIGNVYVTDAYQNIIRKIDISSNVTTLSGLGNPNGIAIDSAGKLIFVDSSSGQINRVTPPQPAAGGFVVPSELISTNRGLGNYYISTSGLQSTLNSFGPGAASNLTSSIDGLLGGPQTSQSMLISTCDNLGQQYLSSLTLPLNAYQTPSNYLTALSNQNGEYSNMVANSIATYTANATANTTPTVQYGGTGVEGFLDGPRMSAQFYRPEGLAVDSAGIIYVADRFNHRIRKISSTGMVTTLAGSISGFSNAQGTAARFNRPNRVAVDSAGNVYVTETDNHRIRKIDINSNVTTLAGSGAFGFANGQGTAAQFYEPWGVAVDSAGFVYVTDYQNHLIRKIDTSSNVTTLAGSTAGFSNGQGTAAQFRFPAGVTVDLAGIIYLVEHGTNIIRKIDTSSNVTTVAGFVNLKSGSPAYPTLLSGSTVFTQLIDIAIDSEGVIYVTDGDRPAYIRIIDRTANRMYTMQSFEVLFGGGIAIDLLGNIYISHAGGNISSGTFVGPIILKFSGSRIELNNATTTAIASLPAYPTITSSNVTTNIQSNTVAIYSGGYISSSKYLAVNPTSLSLSNLYSFCNVRANAFYASNADGTNGQFFADGTLLTSTSDRRLKREIVRMSNAIDKIQALSGVYYTRNDDPSHQRRVGFIAQEVEAVFPDLVFTDNSQMNYKSIKYESIGVALLEAIKELDIQCDELLSTIV